MSGSRLALRWLLVILWAAAIFALSHLSHPPLPPSDGIPLDKPAHFIEFGILGLLLARATHAGRAPHLPILLLAGALGVGYAALDELHQSFVAMRSSEWGDFLADAAGVVTAVIVYAAIARRTPRFR